MTKSKTISGILAIALVLSIVISPNVMVIATITVGLVLLWSLPYIILAAVLYWIGTKVWNAIKGELSLDEIAKLRLAEEMTMQLEVRSRAIDVERNAKDWISCYIGRQEQDATISYDDILSAVVSAIDVDDVNSIDLGTKIGPQLNGGISVGTDVVLSTHEEMPHIIIATVIGYLVNANGEPINDDVTYSEEVLINLDHIIEFVA